jgi:NAD(P)-dependent dehydrogenase (short-subunit alcohol dehydrogenase family)
MKKRVLVLTGAGGGIGSVFAKGLAADGYAIALLDYNKQSIGELAEQINGENGVAVAIQCDVTKKESLEQARSEVRRTLGPCNVLVNCAGIQDPLAKTSFEQYAPGHEKNTHVAKMGDDAADLAALVAMQRTIFNIDTDAMDRVMRVNWLGTVVACQVFGVDMVGTEGNSIINITSMAAYEALSLVPAYASSKAAVDMFTKWLSNYISNEYGKVRVNAVAPGYFLTPLNRDMYVHSDGTHTERYAHVINRTPMGRLGDIQDLLGAVRFFADPTMSGYITGQMIAVDGGFLSCPGI